MDKEFAANLPESFWLAGVVPPSVMKIKSVQDFAPHVARWVAWFRENWRETS